MAFVLLALWRCLSIVFWLTLFLIRNPQICIFYSVCMCISFPWPLWRFTFYHGFSKNLCEVFPCSTCLGFCWASWICGLTVFLKFATNVASVFSNNFIPFSLSPFYETLITHVLTLHIVPWTLRICSFGLFFPVCFSLHSFHCYAFKFSAFSFLLNV